MHIKRKLGTKTGTPTPPHHLTGHLHHPLCKKFYLKKKKIGTQTKNDRVKTFLESIYEIKKTKTI